MELRNERELSNTREKLRLLESIYQQTAAESDVEDELREIELESLMRFINQLKEEIARYEARRTARAVK